MSDPVDMLQDAAEPEPEPVACPKCGHHLTLDMPYPPKPGDLNLCRQCQTLSRFTETGSLRLLGPREFKELPAETKHEIRRTLHNLKQKAADAL